MRAFQNAIMLAAVLVGASGCESHDVNMNCPQKPLGRFCTEDCPKDVAAATRLACDYLGHIVWPSKWLRAENDCGGISVRSRDGYTGVAYFFGGNDELVGAMSWSDIIYSGACPNDHSYGEPCEAVTTFVEQVCPVASP